MRDIIKDWQRWSPTERLMAVLIVTFLVFGVPFALTMSITSTIPVSHTTTTERAL